MSQAYQDTSWAPGAPVDISTLQQMTTNDDYIYGQVAKNPKGIMWYNPAYRASTNAYMTIVGAPTGAWVTVDQSYTFSQLSGRIIRMESYIPVVSWTIPNAGVTTPPVFAWKRNGIILNSMYLPKASITDTPIVGFKASPLYSMRFVAFDVNPPEGDILYTLEAYSRDTQQVIYVMPTTAANAGSNRSSDLGSLVFGGSWIEDVGSTDGLIT